MRRILLSAGVVVAMVVASTALWWIRREQPRSPLTAHGQPVVTVMDFSEPVATDPPAAGWYHRIFWTAPPMTISQETVDGVPALKLQTAASGSIFGRYVDIAVAEYPRLRWSWRVETPIDPAFDERTAAGDDHAARLFLRFLATGGEERNMEIIWSNGAFQPGEYKVIDGFPHYVAHSGTADTGLWIDEEVDLREVYAGAFGRDDVSRLTLVAIFCDSDDTETESLAYFGPVSLLRR